MIFGDFSNKDSVIRIEDLNLFLSFLRLKKEFKIKRTKVEIKIFLKENNLCIMTGLIDKNWVHLNTDYRFSNFF